MTTRCLSNMGGQARVDPIDPQFLRSKRGAAVYEIAKLVNIKPSSLWFMILINL
jgi:hypothetical protein